MNTEKVFCIFAYTSILLFIKYWPILSRNTIKKPEKSSYDFVTKTLDVVSKVGWPGFLLLCSLFAVQNWTTIEQKQKLIDIYLIQPYTSFYQRPIIVELLLVALILFAQKKYYNIKYKKRIELSEKELKRVAKEKTALQQELISRPLTSSSTSEEENHAD